MVNSISTRKAQVWFFDFMIAVLIFSATLTLYFTARENVNDTREEMLSDILSKSKLATGDLMSVGYPQGWNTTNVTRVGILGNDGRFNATKIEKFYNFTPQSGRSALGLGSVHYFAYMQYINGTVLSFGGKNETGENATAKSLVVQTTRLGVYNNSFVQLKFIAWREP